MNIGAHISTAGGLEKCFERAEKLGCSVIQIFTKSPSQWKAKPITDNVAYDFRKRWSESAISHVIAHNAYLINLAHPQDYEWNKSFDAMLDELNRADKLGIKWLITHSGNHLGSGETNGIERIVDAITRLLYDTQDLQCGILIETTAGQGSSIGTTFEQLASMIEKIDCAERTGVCLDTAHIFAAGYDIRTSGKFEKVLRKFSRTIGLKKLKAIHLNDSKKPLGSRIDRHANIGDGEIGVECFRFLVNRKPFMRIPMILETPGGEKMFEKDMILLRKLKT
ncbi:deoxyribonuclease IV [bacterium]|nr:deoxyribonuclease IV [bacterium]